MTTVTTVPSMTEDMKQRTGKKKYVWEVSVDMRPMLGDEEEADDGEEAEEGDVETAHSESWNRRNYS